MHACNATIMPLLALLLGLISAATNMHCLYQPCSTRRLATDQLPLYDDRLQKPSQLQLQPDGYMF